MGFGKKFKKAAKKVGKTVSSGVKSVGDSIESGIKALDPTTKEGLLNIATGGMYGVSTGLASYAGDKLGLGGNSGGSEKTEADDIYANLIRDQWEGFEKKDMNYIRDYANRIVSGKDITDSLSQATEGVNRGFDLSQNTQLRQQAGLGLGLNDAQRLDQAADQKRNRTASLVDAQNAAYTAAKDRQDALLAGAHMPKTQVTR